MALSVKKQGGQGGDEMLRNWREAEDALRVLQDAPNQELRGRGQRNSLKRVERFLKNDRIVRALKQRVEGGKSRRQEFLEAVKRSLGIYEKLADRNPDPGFPYRTVQAARFAHRLIALRVFEELFLPSRGRKAQKSVLGIRRVTKTRAEPVGKRPVKLKRGRPPRKCAHGGAHEAGSSTPELPAAQRSEESGRAARGRRRLAHERQQAAEASAVPGRLPPENKPLQELSAEDLAHRALLETVREYLDGSLSSVRAQSDLAKRLFDPANADQLRRVLGDLGLERGLLQGLEWVAMVHGEAEGYSAHPNPDFLAGLTLHKRIAGLNQCWGLQDHANMFEQLRAEGIAGGGTTLRLERCAKVWECCPQPGRDLILRMGKLGKASMESAELITQMTKRLQRAGLPDHRIETFLKAGKAEDPERLPHLDNCTHLAGRDLPIHDFAPLSKPAALQVIARAANTDLDTLPCGHPGYARELLRRIQLELRLAGNAPHIAEAVDAACRSLGERLQGVDSTEFRESLAKIGRSLSSISLQPSLRTAAHDLASLAPVGVRIHLLAAIVAQPPQEIGTDRMLSFLSALSALHHEGVDGVDRLAEQFVRNASMNRDWQSFEGYIYEAEVATKLSRSGYRLVSLSKSSFSGYEYDIVAYSPQGELLGIEVKRQFDTLWARNETRLKSGQGHSQVRRFMWGADRDRVIPTIAFARTQFGSWSQTAVSNLLSSLETETGSKPRVLNGLTGREILL